MKKYCGYWLLMAVPLIISFAGTALAEDCPDLVKEVDWAYAHASEVLTYSIVIQNSCTPAPDVGLFTDNFPPEVANCSWTCLPTRGGGCEFASGTGDIQQLISVPVGSSVTIEAVCTFNPSTGHECAVNTAEYLTMDPDILKQDTAITCDWTIIVFFSGFETGTTSGWDEVVW